MADVLLTLSQRARKTYLVTLPVHIGDPVVQTDVTVQFLIGPGIGLAVEPLKVFMQDPSDNGNLLDEAQTLIAHVTIDN